MASQFKHGELVRLKSGGPNMTVEVLPGEKDQFDYTAIGYGCVWFKSNALNRDEFPSTS